MPSGFSPSLAEYVRKTQFKVWNDWEWFSVSVHFWGSTDYLLLAYNQQTVDVKMLFLDKGEDPFEAVYFLQTGGEEK